MRIGLYPFFPVNRRLTRDVVNNDNKEEDDAYDRDEDDDSVDDDDDDDDWSVSLPPYPVNRGLTRAKAPPRPPESLIYLVANTVLLTSYCAVLIVLQASYTSSPPTSTVVEIWYLCTHFAILYYYNIVLLQYYTVHSVNCNGVL